MELLAMDALTLEHLIHINPVRIWSASRGFGNFADAIEPSWLFEGLFGILETMLNS